MKDVHTYQQSLLTNIQHKWPNISPESAKAFLDTPRHLFIDQLITRNESGEFIRLTITEDNLDDLLPELYRDVPIALALDEKGKGISSISQPTIVVKMLEKLQLRPGHQVLEIGTASGWNAALMANIIGPQGRVYSVEIISDLAKKAKQKIRNLGIDNVSVLHGDGAKEGFGQEFDRIVFTVGAYDIPAYILNRLKDKGRLLMVLKNRGPLDCLLLFEKQNNSLVSLENGFCKFVPLAGKSAMSELDHPPLDEIPLWQELQGQMVHKEEFWWGTKSNLMGERNKKVVGIASFLAIVEADFFMFTGENQELCFGLMLKEDRSIVLWQEDQLRAYGNDTALKKLKKAFETFFALGMPGADCFEVKAYPIDLPLSLETNQWLVRRRDTQFLWHLGRN